MNDEATPDLPGAPADSLPPAARAELAGIAWEELPHVCTGRHGVPDTPDVLGALLAADPARRVRAVEDLYRLLLHRERAFPATAPAALVVARLLDDPRTLAEDRWEGRAGRRPLRAELLNWLASFADLTRPEASPDIKDGVGTVRDPAARAVRPVLHDRIVGFCDADDPRVREAALAATALLLDDPALAPSVPRYAPAVRTVLAASADSSYRRIARERLAAWGEDVTGLVAAEEERRATLERIRALADDPFAEGQEEAIRRLAEQPEDTAAPGWFDRRREARTAPVRPTSRGPAPETPVAAPGSGAGHRGPWRIAREEERAEWTFTPYVGIGPLHFGMAPEEIADALGERPSPSRPGEDRQPRCVDFTGSGIRALFRDGRLGCVAVDALTGPQVRLDGAPLTGCAPSRVEDWLVHRTAPRPGSLTYSPAADPVFADLGLAIRPQRAGDAVLTRPLFLLPDWLDLWHALPAEEWNLS
ncbi:serine/threonine-protein kinase [Streptomyces cinereoruber]|uniref:hypothetical protein n=1 Tax=Streptomyces cinereoruber TaxID=67260 RepID=UPI00362CADA6